MLRYFQKQWQNLRKCHHTEFEVLFVDIADFRRCKLEGTTTREEYSIVVELHGLWKGTYYENFSKAFFVNSTEGKSEERELVHRAIMWFREVRIH